MLILIGLHAAAAALLVFLGGNMGRRTLPVAGGVMAATVAWGLAVSGQVFGGDPVVESLEWVPSLGISVDVSVDALSLVMVLLVSGIGVLVVAYSWWYFGDDPKVSQFAGLTLAFAGSMLGIVVADNMLLLFVFWEITSVASFLLIGLKDTEAPARSAALQALLVTAMGGLAMLAGIVLVALQAGTFSLSEVISAPPQKLSASVGVVLILVGAFTKSAQVPFHFWLPGAMAASTPVSAYLHSATMVKAGVFLVARLGPSFGVAYPFWVPVVAAVGLLTMLVGGIRALFQHDLKLLLALGTVSQLGLLMALFGLGDLEVGFAAIALLLAHGVFKAALFMVVGIVDHETHSRDLRRLTGLWRRMPGVATVATIAAASMAGIPLLFGFVAKEAVLEGLLHWDEPARMLVAWTVVAGSALTAAYGARFLWGAFATKRDLRDPVEPESVARPPRGFIAPAAVLAGLTVLWGVAPGLVEPAVASAATAAHRSAHSLHLAAWHGLGHPLALSALAIVIGLVSSVAVKRGVGSRLARMAARVPNPTAGYASSLNGLNHLADRTTAVVQPGSLPFYTGVILLTVVALPGGWLIRSFLLPEGMVLSESPFQLVAALAVATAAVGAAAAARRMGAVVFLGAVGYSVAVLFIVHGAPDLALTQVLIETLTLAIFVLVLRLLPERFESTRWRLQRVWRVTISTAIGVFVAAFTLAATAGRVAEPVGDRYLDLADQAGGKNVVNLILTDFRALDTLGEITVLAVAALGIIALVGASRRADDDEEPA